MTTTSLIYFYAILIFLILLSAFFSGSETGMMALNRYRVRHLARKGDRTAIRVVALLKRPDRLLGVILIGNTFANILASSIATIIASHYLGVIQGALLATILLTFVILIFAETAPKTLAATHPQRVAFSVSLPLKLMLQISYPLVWLVNFFANGMLRLFHVKLSAHRTDPLSIGELRTVVREASGKISSNYQDMLLRVLDLGRVTIEDVMIPRSEIDGIDITDEWDNILKKILEGGHAYMPIYRENIDTVIGMLNLRRVLMHLHKEELSKQKLIRLAHEVYFIPEVTLLSQQLLNFQKEGQFTGIVVDEYGDIQGLVTLQDILEEIVGEFTLESTEIMRLVKQQPDGSYLVDARINLRELNRITGWELPIDGPKTLSGLIIEYLEVIPVSRVCLLLAGYPIEVISISRNKIRKVQLWPNRRRKTK